MGSRKWSDVYASHNGVVYLICHDLGETKQNSVQLVPLKFSKENNAFRVTCSPYSFNIAQDTVCYAVKTCIYYRNTTARLTLLMRNTTNEEFVVLHLLDGRLQVLCKYITTSECGIVDSQISTQSNPFSTRQTEKDVKVTHSEFHVNAAFILDGPTVVLFAHDDVYFSTFSYGDIHKTNLFTRAKLNLSTKGFCLLWTGLCDNYILILGTVVTKCECDTKEEKTQVKHSCPHQMHRSRSKYERMVTAIRIKLIQQNLRETQNVECDVECIQGRDFIPILYSTIILCVMVKKCSPVQPSSDDSTPTLLYHSETYACTTLKQLLRFKDGHVKDCTAIPTDCASKIEEFESFYGETYIIVWSTKKVIIVKESSFQVIQVIPEVRSFLIDDFVGNGGEQLLLLLTNPKELNKNGQTCHLGDYILTDCEGIHLESSVKNSVKKIDDATCSGSISCAIQALKTRQQVAFQSLFKAEQLSQSKHEVILQSSAILRSMFSETVSGCYPRMNNRLVQFLGTNMKKPGSATSHYAKPEEKHNCEDSSEVTVEDCIMMTSHLDHPSTLVPSDGDHQVHSGVEALEIWHQVVTPDCLIVGVKICNMTDCGMENIHCYLVSNGAGSSVQRDLMYHSKAVTVTKQNKNFIPSDLQPLTKKAKRPPLFSVQVTNSLSPNCTCYVLCKTTLPRFGQHPARDYALVLVWNRCHSSRDSNLYEVQYQECGRIRLTVDNLCSGSALMNLKDVLASDLKSFLCLEMIQLTRTVQINCLLGGLLQCLQETLDSLGFKFISQLQTYLCDTEGPLLWTRAKLLQHENQFLYLNVSTRNDDQLILFIHALYGGLPDDVTIQLSNQKELSAAVQSSLHCLYNELTWTESQLALLIKATDNDDSQMGQTAGNDQTMKMTFEQCTERIRKREDGFLDGAKMEEFLQRWREMIQITDHSAHDLVRVLKL